MSIEDTVLRKLRALPPEQQREVLDFVEFLRVRSQALPRATVKGLFADLGVSLDEKDVDRAREEMWGRFPHEDL